MDIKESNGKLYVIEVNDNPSLEGGEDANYPDMFRRIVSYLMTGDASDYADEIWPRAIGPYGFEGEYGLGADAPLPKERPLWKTMSTQQDRLLGEVDISSIFLFGS